MHSFDWCFRLYYPYNGRGESATGGSMKKKSSHWLFLAIALLFTISWAQEESEAGFEDLSLSSLLNLALQTGSFLELDLKKSPLSMTVITRDQVTASGARHLTELLEIYVPGFQYMYNKWNGEIWGMRGVAADRNTKFIFLVNGHKMNHESRDGAMSELNLGLLGDIERVEVLRGPAGLVYGSGAIAGIVNVVTRRYDGDKTVVRGGLGTWDFEGTSREVGADVYRGLGENQSIILSMAYRSSDGLAPEEARLWGRPHWPYPQWLGSDGQSSVPAAGCAWCTPGNWRVSLDYTWDKLRMYSRVTHQVSNAGGMFIVDPWPEDQGNADVHGTPRWVDGELVTQYSIDSVRFVGTREQIIHLAGGIDSVVVDSVYDTTWTKNWWGSTDAGNTSRRQYVVDNVMAEMTYDWDIGMNVVKFKAGFDGVTNRIQREERKGNETLGDEERNVFIEETFGEKRYSLGATFLLKSVDKLQAAAGYEIRRDDIGDDLTGKNMQAEKANHYIVSDLTYYNNAVFSEAMLELNPKLYLHGGLRYDVHTRTQDQGGVLSPKVAMIFIPHPDHSIKLIYQTSANNGSADNYEFNRNNIDDAGVPYTGYHFEKPTELPGANSTPIPSVTESELHKLNPERVRSLELASMDQFGVLSIQPSISYNKVSDLFNWNQSQFRIVNAGEYEFINAEIEASLDWRGLKMGGSHTFQRLVNMDLGEQDLVTISDGFANENFWVSYVENGVTKYRPVTNGEKDTSVINAIKNQISVDGDNFLNLNTHISKFYVDYQLLPSVLLHSDLRIFWGLEGRDDLVEADPDFEYLNIHLDPMFKWNASAHWMAGTQTRISLYAYDLLAAETGTGAINSLRWQQSGNSKEHTDLFGLDRRSFAVVLEQTF